jgi:hypothetical protein
MRSLSVVSNRVGGELYRTRGDQDHMMRDSVELS